MNVLITRPEPQAALTVARLEDAGYSVFSEPCQIVGAVEAVLQSASAYIITSQNGVEYGLKHVTDKDAVIFAVGDKTAQAAEDLGFNIIFSAEGDSESLIELILDRWLPEEGNLIHLSGAEISSNISALLSAIGYSARRSVVYEAIAQARPSHAMVDLLKNNKIDVVLFYSAQAVTIFNGWIEQEGLENCIKSMQAIVMSERIAQRLDGVWKCTKIAQARDEDEIIKLLNEES
jgi:uroporphyrinogen-III synthase